MEVGLEETNKENWREVIAHNPNILIQDVDVSRHC
jgi:protease II